MEHAERLLGLVLSAVRFFRSSERTSLSFVYTESESFPIQGASGRYLKLVLRNDGGKPIQNVEFNIGVSQGIILEVADSKPEFSVKMAKEERAVEGTIALLNGKEEVAVTLTLRCDDGLLELNGVARALGASTTLRMKEPRVRSQLFTVSGIGFAILFLPWATWVTRSLNQQQVRLDQITQYMDEYRLGRPDQEELIFGAMTRSGLGHLVPRLLDNGDGASYWKSALFLTFQFLTEAKDREKYKNALSALSEISPIAPSSVGFILYQRAKVEQYLGNANGAIRLLEECKARAPKMYEYLMGQDPAYDLRNIRRSLTEGRK